MADAQLGPRYAALLSGAFARKGWSSALAGGALVLAGVAYSVTGKTFLPTMDEGSVIVQLTKAPSISLEHSLEDDLKVQKALLAKVPEVTEVIARTGRRAGARPDGPWRDRQLFAPQAAQRMAQGDKAWLVDQIREALPTCPASRPAIPSPSRCAFPKC
jgi:cobalt-zinc-cadmium resistance protein CzcA